MLFLYSETLIGLNDSDLIKCINLVSVEAIYIPLHRVCDTFIAIKLSSRMYTM